MMHEQAVEYRYLNILRVKFLRDLQENGGSMKVNKFRTMLKSVMRNVSADLVDLLINQSKADPGEIVSYQKLCEIIDLYQYCHHIAK